jgi:hypothetical protein
VWARIGQIENGVATHIFVRETYAMIECGFHELRVHGGEEET